MKLQMFVTSVSVAGLFMLASQVSHAGPVPSGSAGTGSSVIDAGSAATGSAGLSQTGSVGGAYADCDQARVAGHAPIFTGEPGYSPKLDGEDGIIDGFACPTV
ncbi:hypothetical protein O3I_023560 [Nocardia brasiliensis ATCC 700358]|uniref:Excalibur calcium-binding domain-containing protein n=2 Tax=Nocardia brasiliensis TaxID=37326 RepID=K0EYV2_NOCB7|nr:hypothetical protein O3I_023560 [Nocardia brasiliensis ATCC 700358]